MLRQRRMACRPGRRIGNMMLDMKPRPMISKLFIYCHHGAAQGTGGVARHFDAKRHGSTYRRHRRSRRLYSCWRPMPVVPMTADSTLTFYADRRFVRRREPFTSLAAKPTSIAGVI